MASFLDKIKVKTAVDDRTKLDLSCNHISTASFMQYNVAWKKELVPGEKISVNMETFTRLAPMPVPTFGRANINNRAFFVPFRTIFPGWNDFITDSVHVSATGTTGIASTVPYFKNADFVKEFLTPSAGYAVSVSEGKEDISVVTYTSATASGPTFWALTPRGRQLLKIMESLGYKFLWVYSATSSINAGLQPDINPSYSALPLLAAVKVYFDWYYPSAYVNLDTNGAIESMFKRDGATNTQILDTDIRFILRYIPYVNYDSDYFVSAWDNPVNPNNGGFSNVSIKDPSNGSTATYDRTVSVSAKGTQSGSDNAPLLGGTSLNAVSQFAVDALKSLTDYMKRHQLVGARSLDRYLARFGVNLPAEKLNRSVYLGSQTQPLQFGDVMSTADTETSALGNYAGKGISYGEGNFDFETDEYGIMIIISTIIPQIGYYQGIDRNNLHLTKLDYWTPEFDNLGTQAISKSELFVPFYSTAGFNGLSYLGSEVFGWTPRYAEYKVAHDKVTGDFRYHTVNAGTNSWHLMREISASNTDDLVHNVGFVTGTDAAQYDRIFYNTNSVSTEGAGSTFAADKFNIIYNFNVMSLSPMKSLFDTYEFDSHGKEVTEDVNGVKMN